MSMPWIVEAQIRELQVLHAQGHISERMMYEQWDAIEQTAMADEHRARAKARGATISRKAFTLRDDQLRRKGLRIMPGRKRIFQLYGTTWNGPPDYHSTVFLPYSCTNLDQFVDRGKILWNHNSKMQIGAPIRATQDGHGLLIEAEWLDNRRGRDFRTIVRERMEAGKVCAASIHMDRSPVVEQKHLFGQPVNVVRQFSLAGECSFVKFGAHPDAVFVQV